MPSPSRPFFLSFRASRASSSRARASSMSSFRVPSFNSASASLFTCARDRATRNSVVAASYSSRPTARCASSESARLCLAVASSPSDSASSNSAFAESILLLPRAVLEFFQICRKLVDTSLGLSHFLGTKAGLQASKRGPRLSVKGLCFG